MFTFLDGGNVWGSEGNSIGANGLRYGYGLGLAWISPIGPLKLSLGFPAVNHTGDQYEVPVSDRHIVLAMFTLLPILRTGQRLMPVSRRAFTGSMCDHEYAV